jgi:hypothetical protein
LGNALILSCLNKTSNAAFQGRNRKLHLKIFKLSGNGNEKVLESVKSVNGLREVAKLEEDEEEKHMVF